MIRVEHRRSHCSGCQVCVDFLPAYYQINSNDGLADLIGATPYQNIEVLELPDTERQLFQEVANHCPDKVIRIT